MTSVRNLATIWHTFLVEGGFYYQAVAAQLSERKTDLVCLPQILEMQYSPLILLETFLQITFVKGRK